ncbi:MAG: hypothetical protein ACJA0S_001329 [Rickettsiales bacterium]|jgi:hypothetical protein
MQKVDNKLQSVTDQILGHFLKSLSSEEDFKEISERLENIVLNEKTPNEKELHRAIFEEDI